MSMHIVFYIGPYFKCRASLKPVSLAELEEKFKDSIVNWVDGKEDGEDFSCWIPNERRNPPRNFVFDAESKEGETMLSSADIDDEKDWLKEKFSKEWKEFTNYFVKEYTVETEWGVLCRYC